MKPISFDYRCTAMTLTLTSILRPRFDNAVKSDEQARKPL